MRFDPHLWHTTLTFINCTFFQVHGSRDSVVNIEIEGPSTSIGPSELVPHDGSRDHGANAVEVIRYQPAQVEYHDIPSSPESGGIAGSPPGTMGVVVEEDEEEEIGEAEGEKIGLVSGQNQSGNQVTGSTEKSLDSVQTLDSEVNELQSLMQNDANDQKEIVLKSQGIESLNGDMDSSSS